MNNSIVFKKGIWVFFLALALAFTSCSKSDDLVSNTNDNESLKSAVLGPVPVTSFAVVNGTCGVQSQALIAGQNYTAGNVVVSTTADGKLYISVATQNGWSLKGIHLYVGAQALLPINKSGNPVPGSFPVNSSYSTYQNAVSFEYNVAAFSSCFVVALHAEVDKLGDAGQVLQSETAWAAGTLFVLKGNWATYFNYCVVPCAPPPPTTTPVVCAYETAFGGNAAGSGNAWWYYYDGVGVETIWAGQHINAGTVEKVGGNLVITLANGWALNGSTLESVKIQGYTTLPSNRPAAGLFTTYKGTGLTVPVGSYPYYVVHLDVQKCQ